MGRARRARDDALRHDVGRVAPAAPPTGFPVGRKVVPDAEIDLVGAYVARGIPSGALVLLAEERPGDYWYVMPVTIALAAIGLIFGWALVRAVKRDLLGTVSTKTT